MTSESTGAGSMPLHAGGPLDSCRRSRWRTGQPPTLLGSQRTILLLTKPDRPSRDKTVLSAGHAASPAP